MDIVKPTVLVDKEKVIRNIHRMTRKAEKSRVKFRPHFKTHQSAEIGEWFRDAGVTSITVSSVDMALYFAESGWQDITIAFPVNVLEIEKIDMLAKSIHLHLLVDNENALTILQQQLAHPVNVWLKIDVGYGRVGVHWQDIDTIMNIVKRIHSQPNLHFSGLLTHFGQSYTAKAPHQIRKIYNESVSRLNQIKSEIMATSMPRCDVSIGDTPCCSIVENFREVDEIRPGNFVFYDLMQHQLGSCGEDDIAISVACPVVGKYVDRNQIAIYGGAVHFSKESIIDENGEKIYGYLTHFKDNKWDAADKKGRLVSISQEHGLLQVDSYLFHQIELGDLLLILPVHSCLTANLHNEYMVLGGKTIRRFNSLR